MELLQAILKATETELSKKISRPRYKVPNLSYERAVELLTLAYLQEVHARNREFEQDEITMIHLQQVAKWLTSEDCKPMLLLAGGTGNGKTTMAKAVVRMITTLQAEVEKKIRTGMFEATEEERRAVVRFSGRIVTPVLVMATDLAYWLTYERERTPAAIFEREFLIIDDLGAEPAVIKNFGTAVTPVTDLLYKRCDKMLMTIVTTNLTQKGIAETYGERMSDRLAEVFDTIGYTSKSYRRNKTI